MFFSYRRDLWLASMKRRSRVHMSRRTGNSVMSREVDRPDRRPSDRPNMDTLTVRGNVQAPKTVDRLGSREESLR